MATPPLPVPPSAAFVLTWECTNGGGLSMTANGTVTYHLPGNESGGAGGPGNPCGGGGGGSSGGNDDGTVDPPGGGGGATLWWGASCDSVPLQTPEGWPAEEFESLTWGEKLLVLFDEPPKWFQRRHKMRELVDLAYSQSKAVTGTSLRLDDRQQNAFQHAIWSAAMSREFGPHDAVRWTTAHEDLGRQLNTHELKQRSMDLHDNAVGHAAAGSGTSALDDVVANAAQLCWLLGSGARQSCP